MHSTELSIVYETLYVDRQISSQECRNCKRRTGKIVEEIATPIALHCCIRGYLEVLFMTYVVCV